MSRVWKELVEASAAIYAREQQKLAPILKREARLRADLQRLDAHDDAARAQCNIMAAVGADIAWNAWLAGAREQLNRELAQVLALKESRLGTIRKAFARHSVAQQTVARIAKAERKSRDARALQSAIDQEVLAQLLNQ